jgi:hypothetical protein
MNRNKLSNLFVLTKTYSKGILFFFLVIVSLSAALGYLAVKWQPEEEVEEAKEVEVFEDTPLGFLKESATFCFDCANKFADTDLNGWVVLKYGHYDYYLQLPSKEKNCPDLLEDRISYKQPLLNGTGDQYGVISIDVFDNNEDTELEERTNNGYPSVNSHEYFTFKDREAVRFFYENLETGEVVHSIMILRDKYIMQFDLAMDFGNQEIYESVKQNPDLMKDYFDLYSKIFYSMWFKTS